MIKIVREEFKGFEGHSAEEVKDSFLSMFGIDPYTIEEVCMICEQAEEKITGYAGWTNFDLTKGWFPYLKNYKTATGAICNYIGEMTAKSIQDYDKDIVEALLIEEYNSGWTSGYRFVIAYPDRYITVDKDGITEESAD